MTQQATRETTHFVELVTKYSYSLRPFALSLTRDDDDAQDLLQETVFRALSCEDKYAAGTNLKAWLYTIMKNIFINNYRRKVKRNLIMDSSQNEHYLNSTANSTINVGEMNIAVNDITDAIEKLNRDYRTPFLMHYQGFKYHEIAEHLTLPIGTVKSRIHFARKELKQKIAKR